MTEETAPTLVVGLGNPILGDDGVGWAVVELLGELLEDPGVEVERRSVGGVALMEQLLGHRRAIIVDALLGGADPVGTVRIQPLEALDTRAASHLDSSHDTTLLAALAAATELGARVPAETVVVSVAIERADRFSTSLSAPVAAAIGPAVAAVLEVLAASPRPTETPVPVA